MSIFSGPKKPAPPTPAPAAPERSSADIQEAAAEQRKRYGTAGGLGRSDTILTGGLGVPNDQLSSQAVQLLGSVAKV